VRTLTVKTVSPPSHIFLILPEIRITFLANKLPAYSDPIWTIILIQSEHLFYWARVWRYRR